MSYNPGYGAPGQPQGYPGQQMQYGYPGQPQQQGYPGQPPQQQGYPGQPRMYAYPGQQPQQAYAAAAAQQQQQQQAYAAAGQQMPPGYGAPAIDPTVVSWFRAVDQDNSGQINERELSLALQNGNRSNFSEEACRLMISMFDRDHSGTINIHEFSQLFQYINKWTEVYRQHDQDKSGTIDEMEMGIALTKMGYRLSGQFVAFMVTKFSPRERKISLDHFIVSNVQLHRLTEAFKKKDVEQKGVATLTYEEFITLGLTV